MASSVHYARSGAVATLTLDAPQRRNALSAGLLAELAGHLRTAAADPDVRTVVLSHTGPVFCSGMDLSATADVPPEQQPVNAFPAVLEAIWTLDKPTIARVAGKARAGGIGLLAACDIVLASPAADFAFTEVRLGLAPAVISVTVLPRLSAPAALELCLTGETFDAERAERIGLVNRVAADLDAEVQRYAALLRQGEPAALAATKAMLRRDRAGRSTAEDLARMGELSARLFAAPAAQEGFAAFAARRPPSWAAG